MERIYLDQNVTKELCNNPYFFNQFKRLHNTQPKLIITPRALIELSGVKIKDCLKEKNEYQPDFSESLLNRTGTGQADKALDYYENNIRGDVFTILKKGLNEQKQYVKTECGDWILNSYLEYLNSMKGMEDIPFGISCDRVFALPLERFRDEDTYFHIYNLATLFLTVNPHIPCLRLFIKSYKKLPPANNQREREEFRKQVKKLAEESDLKQDSDLVDIELIQFSILGYDGHSVHFYTQDAVDKIKKRLFLFYLLFKQVKLQSGGSLRNEMDTPTSKDIPLEKIKRVANFKFGFGKISIINNSGNLRENIDVRELLSSQKIIF